MRTLFCCAVRGTESRLGKKVEYRCYRWPLPDQSYRQSPTPALSGIAGRWAGLFDGSVKGVHSLAKSQLSAPGAHSISRALDQALRRVRSPPGRSQLLCDPCYLGDSSIAQHDSFSWPHPEMLRSMPQRRRGVANLCSIRMNPFPTRFTYLAQQVPRQDPTIFGRQMDQPAQAENSNRLNHFLRGDWLASVSWA